MREDLSGTFRITSALIAGFLLLGCQEEAGGPAVEGPSPLVSRAIVWATSSRHLDSRGSPPFERFSVAALFARYCPEHRELLTGLLARGFEEPEIALDSCGPPTPVIGQKQRRPVPGETAIELLDAGNLTLIIDGATIPVPTRAFPDLLKVIDGVMYSAEESQGVRFLPGAAYTVRSPGTDIVGPFEVVLEAPEDLGDVKLDGSSPLDQPPPLARGEDLEITWEGTGWGDEVIAEFTWTSLGLPWSMVCRMRDDGSFVVSGDRTRNLQDPLRTGDEELTLSRIRQVAFRSAGLSGGTFSFVVTVHFPVRFDGPG